MESEKGRKMSSIAAVILGSPLAGEGCTPRPLIQGSLNAGGDQLSTDSDD